MQISEGSEANTHTVKWPQVDVDRERGKEKTGEEKEKVTTHPQTHPQFAWVRPVECHHECLLRERERELQVKNV